MDILSRGEIEQLEDAARSERDKLIVRVLADAGLRLGELIALGTEDLKERVRGEYYLHITGKGQRDRLVPLTPSLHRRLQKYIAQYRPQDARSDRVFLAMRKSSDGEYEPLTGSGVNQLISTLTALVGIKKRVYPHLLRHSSSTYCLQRGMNPIQVVEIMGHSSLAMVTNVYAHLTPQDAHLAMMKALLEHDDKRR